MQNSFNNRFDDFPPMMSDSRTFTNYTANINEEIRQKYDIKTNWEYRNYLTNNSDEVIEFNQTSACNELMNGYNRKACKFSDISKPVDNSKYSDLKKEYVAREELQKRLVSSEVPQYKMLKFNNKRAN